MNIRSPMGRIMIHNDDFVDPTNILLAATVLNSMQQEAPPFEGKGGEFGGAGASGSWTEAPQEQRTESIQESHFESSPDSSPDCSSCDS